jgi:ketosteroid isomerase-like protein
MSSAREIGLAYMQALWAGDFERCSELLSGDALWFFQLGMPQAQQGRPRIWPARDAMQRIADDLFGKFDDSGFAVTPSRITAEGDTVVIEYEANGRTARG